MSGMCEHLTPKGFRGDRPGWFFCKFGAKEVPKHRLSNCVRGGCPDYRERGEERVALKWDGPASDVIPGAKGTLLEWAAAAYKSGTPQKQIALEIGTSADMVYQAIKLLRDRQAAKPTRKATSGSCEEETQPAVPMCWNCGSEPADSEHVWSDGHPRCKRCYDNVALTARDYRGPEEPAETSANLRVVDTETETPCPEPVVMCWNCGAQPAVYESSNDHPRCHACYQSHQMAEGLAQKKPVAEPLIADGVTREATLGDPTVAACKAYMTYMCMSTEEIAGLDIWLAAWAAARGDAA